jgi:hypothetical protein
MPLRAGVQDPQDAVEHCAGILPRPTLAAAMLELFCGKVRSDLLPLLVGERHNNGRS